MELPLLAIREQIAGAVHVIVQLVRFACGARRIVQISEVTGTESGRIQLQDLYRFDPLTNSYKATGNLPVFLESMGASERTSIAALMGVNGQ